MRPMTGHRPAPGRHRLHSSRRARTDRQHAWMAVRPGRNQTVLPSSSHEDEWLVVASNGSARWPADLPQCTPTGRPRIRWSGGRREIALGTCACRARRTYPPSRRRSRHLRLVPLCACRYRIASAGSARGRRPSASSSSAQFRARFVALTQDIGTPLKPEGCARPGAITSRRGTLRDEARIHRQAATDLLAIGRDCW